MESKKPFILANSTGIILALLYVICCMAALMAGSVLTVLSGFIGITLITARLFNRGSVWTETAVMLVIAIICACKMWSEKQLDLTFKNAFSIFFEYNLFFVLFVGVISITGLFGLVRKGGKGMYAVIAIVALLLPSVSMVFLEIFEIIVGTIIFVFLITFGVSTSFRMYFSTSSGGGSDITKTGFRDERGVYHTTGVDRDNANAKYRESRGE